MGIAGNVVEKISEEFNEFINQQSLSIWQQFVTQLQVAYEKMEDTIDQEFQIPVSEQQVNLLLKCYVVDNVDAILDLHVDLHDGWFRLYATAKIKGIFLEVAGNFGIVHIQADKDIQRLVFQQLTNVDVISLYCQSYFKTLAVRGAIWYFHQRLKKDPLGLILSHISLAQQKQDIIYVEIGRWLKKSKQIMDTLKKVQVNHAFVAEEQLILKANVNIGNVINLGNNDVLITEADNPDIYQSTDNNENSQSA